MAQWAAGCCVLMRQSHGSSMYPFGSVFSVFGLCEKFIKRYKNAHVFFVGNLANKTIIYSIPRAMFYV